MASFECFVGQLIKVLLVATGEMAAAAEAHRLDDLAHAIEVLVLALLGVDHCRALSALMLRSMAGCFRRPERIRQPGCGSG